MTTESAPPTSTHANPAGEILRLRQQLAAREEVISQLNRRLIERPDTGYEEEPEPDQDALAEALVNGRALEAELHSDPSGRGPTENGDSRTPAPAGGL